MRRAGFTLIEVCLALLVAGTSLLVVMGLFGFGFRESSQSVEDVRETSIADMVMSPLVMALSATNLKWSVFSQLENYPGDGAWAEYFDQTTGIVRSNPEPKAMSAFQAVMAKLDGGTAGTEGLRVDTSFPSLAQHSATLMYCGLVVQHELDSPVAYISFRATKDIGQLMAMPIFFTAVRFQGVVDRTSTGN